MITLCKFSCNYIAVLKNGEVITVPDVERELVFFMEENREEIMFSSDASEKIESAIEAIYPNYFRRGRTK